MKQTCILYAKELTSKQVNELTSKRINSSLINSSTRLLVYSFTRLLILLLPALEVAAQAVKSEEQDDFSNINVLHVVLRVANENDALSANDTLSGWVRDAATLAPIAGARVQLAETPLAVITSQEGRFKIPGNSKAAVLIVTAPDYSLREVALQGRTEATIDLYPEMFTSGYGTVPVLTGTERSALLTEPAASVSDFSRTSAFSAESDLQARLGGDVRTVMRSGVEGMGAAMFIRGLNSLNANAQPLIIVDGVIWDNQLATTSVNKGYFSNPLANIDVKDIESITVLKSGNAIYGSKAANGVILINTVRGKDVVTRIQANLSWGITAQPALPKMMNAQQYKTFASNQIGSFYDYLGMHPLEENLYNDFPFLNDDRENNSRYADYHNDTRWSDYIYQNGSTQDYSVSVNGGDNIALYNLSMGYSTNKGTVKNTSFDRLHARFNSDIKLSEHLDSKVDISISRTLRDLRDDGMNGFSTPGYISLIKAPLLSPFVFDQQTGLLSETLSSYDRIDPYNSLSNPLAIINKASGSSNRTYFNISLAPTYRFNEHLSLGTIFAYTLHRVKESFFLPQEGVAPRVIQSFGVALNEVGDYASRQNATFSDTRLQGQWAWNETHHVDLTGGFRYTSDIYESDLPQGYNTGNDNTKVLTGDGLGYFFVSGENAQWKSMSWYALAQYDYLRKYFLTLTAALDASSRFGKEAEGSLKMLGAAWGLFPSAEAAWIVTAEDFMRDLPALNFLKLRASYSVTGNDDVSSSNSGRAFFAPVQYVGKPIGLQLANIQNEKIKWETSYKANAGLDVHLLNDRLAVTADFFLSRTHDLLTQKLLPPEAGLGYYWNNGGALENRGFEAGFTVKALNLPRFQWEIAANVGHYKNKVTALPDGDEGFYTPVLGGNILTRVGQPVGVFYGYKTEGIFTTTEEASAAKLALEGSNLALTPYQAGDVHFVNAYTGDDRDGYGVINAKDMQVIGDPNPDFYGLISNRFKWKRLSMDVQLTYSYGNDVYNYQRSQLESGSGFDNQTLAMVNRWTGDGQNTRIPRALYGDPMGNSVFSDRWIEDGSYLRLKNVTLSYEIPFNLPYLQGITVWAAGNNLLTFTKYLGSDPEFSMNNSVMYQGIDAGLLPHSRSYFVGLKINL
jgi:TonB-linked SusC/RagA family outer membrane protein